MLKALKFRYRAYRFRYKIDPAEINYIRQNLKPGGIAVDIGAHKGGYLYWLQRGVGKTGAVYAFEPQVNLYNYLRGAIQAMSYQNVALENQGLSSKSGTVSFYIPKTRSGSSPGARIDALTDKTAFDEFKIPVTTLDDYFLSRNLVPNFIKIDVEGHEKQVLRGGLRLLESCKPKILMECEMRHLSEGSVHDVFSILTGLGYTGYFFEHKKRRPLAEFDIERHQKPGAGSFWEAPGYVNNFVF